MEHSLENIRLNAIFADSSVEIVSQFTAAAFGEVSRLEKAEVNLIQLGNSGDLKLLSRSG